MRYYKYKKKTQRNQYSYCSLQESCKEGRGMPSSRGWLLNNRLAVGSLSQMAVGSVCLKDLLRGKLSRLTAVLVFKGRMTTDTTGCALKNYITLYDR